MGSRRSRRDVGEVFAECDSLECVGCFGVSRGDETCEGERRIRFWQGSSYQPKITNQLASLRHYSTSSTPLHNLHPTSPSNSRRARRFIRSGHSTSLNHIIASTITTQPALQAARIRPVLLSIHQSLFVSPCQDQFQPTLRRLKDIIPYQARWIDVTVSTA